MNKILMASLATLAFSASAVYGKGLETLSNSNPETEQKAEAGKDAKPADGAAAASTEPMVQSAASKAIAQKLWIATSFGWVKVSRSEGDWNGSGMTDVAIGYKLMPIGTNMSIDGTYRYAPVAISGEIDDRSYRGVWETHYFGGRFKYNVSQSLTALGTAEAGYVLVYLRPTDNLEQEAKYEENGFSMVVGGGADWHLLENGAFSAGPRLNLGFGSVTTIQVAGAATFLF